MHVANEASYEEFLGAVVVLYFFRRSGRFGVLGHEGFIPEEQIVQYCLCLVKSVCTNVKVPTDLAWFSEGREYSPWRGWGLKIVVSLQKVR